MLGRPCLDVVDDPLVVRRHGDAQPVLEPVLDKPDVLGVDLGLGREHELGRLEVRALDDAQARPERQERP